MKTKFFKLLWIGISPFLLVCNLDGQIVDTFLVKAGTTRTIDQLSTKCNFFIMEDNSTIEVAQESWSIEAEYALIGNGCKIIATGRNGFNGPDQQFVPPNAGKGRNGTHGANGESGGDGLNGKKIVINTGFLKMGDLAIDVRGGRGGNGGKGGTGGKGGGKVYKNGFVSDGGGSGGNGGKGGTSGKGGNGGSVELKYCISDFVEYVNPIKSISVLTSRGSNGVPGEGGHPGAGGGSKGSGAIGVKGDLNPAEGLDGKFISTSINCEPLQTGSNYALVIWESEYSKDGPESEWEKQALALADLLESNYSFEEVVRLDNPSINEIQSNLIAFTQKGSENNVFIVMSGHGDKLGQSIYGFRDTKDNHLSFDAIFGIVNRSNLRSLLLVLNCCYSGKILDNNGISITMPLSNTVKPAYEVGAKKGIGIITAGFEEQKVDTKLLDAIASRLKAHMENNHSTNPYITTSKLYYEILTKGGLETDDRPTLGISNQNNGEFIFSKNQ